MLTAIRLITDLQLSPWLPAILALLATTMIQSMLSAHNALLRSLTVDNAHQALPAELAPLDTSSLAETALLATSLTVVLAHPRLSVINASRASIGILQSLHLPALLA